MKKKHTVEELFEVASGSTPSTSVESYWSSNGNGIKWITPKDLSGLESSNIFTTERKITLEGLNSCSARLIPKESIILSSRAPIGYVAVMKDEMACNQGCKALIPKKPKEVDPLYFYYLFLTKEKELNNLGSGSTFKELSKTKLEEFSIEVHDVKEQQEIAQVLEQADKARQQRKAANALTDQFLQSSFLSLFGDPVKNEKGWEVKTLEEVIIDGPQNGLYVHADSYGSGVPILRIDSFYDGFIENIEQLKRIRIDEKAVNLYLLRENDIVINRVNSRKYLGKSAIVPKLKEDIVFESNMMRFSVELKWLNPLFLIYQLQQAHIRQQILQRAKDSVNQSSINQEDVKSFKIFIPPLSLQQQFAGIVAQAEQLRQKQRESERELENLFQGLLQRYFG